MDGYRISPLQRHVWSLRQAEDRWAYFAQCALRVEGPMEVPRLLQAVRTVVARHEILRTVFPRLKGMATPLQVIRDEPELRFEEIVPTSPFPADEAVFIEEQLAAERQRAPDPVAEPPLKVLWVRFSSQRGFLLLTLPALCADAHSLWQLVRDLVAAYADGPLDHAGERMQYAEIAEWQNTLLEGEGGRAGRDHWFPTRSLPFSGPPLPFERRQQPARSYEPRTASVTVSGETARAIASLAVDASTDASAVLLAAWVVFLWRLTDVPEFVLGCEEDGRGFDELLGALGPCARSLPLRCRLQPQSSFVDVVSGLNADRGEQRKWQDYFVPGFPSEEARRAEPFFGLGFASQRPPSALRAGKAVFTPIRELVTGDRFELRLAVLDSAESVRAELQHDAGRFDSGHMTLVTAQLSALLDCATRNPHVAIETLTSEGKAERLRTRTSGRRKRRPREIAPVHRRFEKQVEKAPDEIVLLDESGAVSRAELNDSADQIARCLVGAGVGPESVVGILAARSRETVAALLGVWKAGAAYLPIDPATPPDRLTFMLSDAGSRWVLCPERFTDRLSGFSGRVLSLGSDSRVVNGRLDGTRRSRERGGNLAYVIYTSGSTGRPKGVAVEHRQLASYVEAILEELAPPNGSSFALVSSFAADLGHTAVFPPLSSGGRVHVVPEERASDPEALAEYFERYPIDYLKIVPSHLQALLSVSRPERILPHRCLVLGGEPCSWDLIETIRALAPECGILNHYGPTETTVGVATYRVPSTPSDLRPATVPVGHPLGASRILLLDRNHRRVPVWVAGELHVAGDTVARGYVGRPDATAGAFEPDSASELEGARVYATGDIARALPDGRVELLGRRDGQVKIHGFRVELGEIEVALRQHPAVRDAVVSARKDDSGVQRLVAYLVAEERREWSQELRGWLRSRLPEFMLPAAFVFLDRLPRTPSGKLDRKALPAPTLEREERRTDAAPRSDAERVLAAVWSDVLGLEQVGIYENFFHLGGDSILGIQIVARAARAGLRLTPRQLFQHQTIAELAAAAVGTRETEETRAPLTGEVPLAPIQQWFFEQDLSEPHHYNQAVLLETRQALSPDLLETAVAALLEHHDGLRLRFSRSGSGWSQAYARAEENRVFSHHDFSTLSQSEREGAMRSVATDLQASLDLSRGPLLRAAQFDFGEDRPGRLLLLAHHLVVDGISWRILLEDLQTGYRQLRAGEAIALPPKTTSYREWSEGLVRFARSEEIESELDYWSALSRVPSPSLPVDRRDGANTVGSARAVRVALDVDETRALLQEVPAAFGTQINDVLVTALLRAFVEWTGKASLLIDLEGHGREPLAGNPDLTRSVGWFTSRFPVFVEVPVAADVEIVLAAVRDQLRRVPRRGVGFGLLRYLADESVTSRLRALPQPLVSFNYLGQYDRVLAEEGFFALTRESAGPVRSPRGERRHLLAIDGSVLEGQLRFSWTYSENRFDRATIERLASAFQAALRRVIFDARPIGATSRVAAEFPESGLTQRDLDALLGQIRSGRKEDV